MKLLRINENRLWDRIHTMAQIGATQKGGVCRVALTDEDKKGRDLFIEWCEAIGCTIRVDLLGNIFARRAGVQEHLPPLLIGSHLDSQPTGGKYDGAYGVLAGLEIFQTLNDHEITTQFPIELVSWTNEEGARFAPAMLSSGVFAGVFDLAYAYGRTDKEGKTVEQELERIGYKGQEPIAKNTYFASFELHIEQGPILEAAQKSVGVVTGVQGIRWYDLIVTGVETHAGPCPMELRKDPVQKAIGLLQEVYELVTIFGNDTRVTIGDINAVPGVRNTVPSKVIVTVDVRHPDPEILEKMHNQLQIITSQAHETDGISVALEEVWHSPPVQFSTHCINAVRAAVKTLEVPSLEMVSGAGHDAVYLSKIMPTSMIFIPCKDGISHNESESITKEDAVNGTNVLLQAILNLNSDFNH